MGLGGVRVRDSVRGDAFTLHVRFTGEYIAKYRKTAGGYMRTYARESKRPRTISTGAHAMGRYSIG